MNDDFPDWLIEKTAKAIGLFEDAEWLEMGEWMQEAHREMAINVLRALGFRRRATRGIMIDGIVHYHPAMGAERKKYESWEAITGWRESDAESFRDPY